MSLRLSLVVFLLLATSAVAQKKSQDNRSGYDKSARATVLHDALLYIAADDTAEKAGEVTPGHEIVIVSRSGPWIQVFANTDTPDDEDPQANADLIEEDNATPPTGWMKDKGVISPGQPGGDIALFGLAAQEENDAEEPHAPKGAAQAAKLLYRRVYQYYPDSKLAAPAAWRSADIRWQLDKRDISTLPSAREQEAYLRPQIYEGELKRVMKLYPRTKYEALAAWDLIDNKLCGDWQGLPKCPEMETGLYMRYSNQYPESPNAAEAEYNAVYRQGVLVTMYKTDNDDKHAQDAAKTAQELADDMVKRFGETNDFAARAQSVSYRVKQGISVYGSDRE